MPLGGGVWINEGGQFSDCILIGTHPYGTAFTEDVPPIGWMGRATHDGPYACSFGRSVPSPTDQPMNRNERIYLDMTRVPDPLQWALDRFKAARCRRS
jgi:hypothetical protein